MKVFNVLTKQEENKNQDELIAVKRYSNDYILSVSHSGLFIPSEFIKKFNICRSLCSGADFITDELYDTGKGIMIISALSRYFVNMNRFRNVSNTRNSAKHVEGQKPLWHFPDVSVRGEFILHKKYSKQEKEKILKFYEKYHGLLAGEIEKMKKKHGFSFVLDCHSMHPKGLPGRMDEGKKRPGFTISTAEDKSAHPRIIDAFYETIKNEGKKFGWGVKKNHPYVGGFITRKYGRPKKRMYALQLEVNKSLYMGAGFNIKKEGLKQTNKIIKKALEVAAGEARNLQ